MNELQKELVDGIEEVVMATGLTVQECVKQALETLGKSVDMYYKDMFDEKFRRTAL